jgi:hypothetical protein
MAQRLDIIQLIETSPITCLSENYQSKFIEKIQEIFTDTATNVYSKLLLLS